MKFVIAFLMAASGCQTASTIGDHEVPTNLNCEEDEAIYFVVTNDPPFELGCVNVEDIK
jgi:hypothetical protein